MAKTSHGRSLLHQRIGAGFLVAAVVLGTQCVSAIVHQGGLLVFGLDKYIGTIKPGDRFDRSILVCNLTLQPVNITVVQACSCSAAQDVHQLVSPFAAGIVHLPYHIIDRDKGNITTRAIFKCAFPNGKEVYYMAASAYTVR